MVAVEVGRPPGLRVNLSRRRRLLARRPPAAPLVAVLPAVVQLLVAARVPVLLVAARVPVLLVAARVPVLRLAVLWGLGSPQERRSWGLAWVRPGAWPISPPATRGPPR